MKHLNIILAFLMTLSAPDSAEDENLFKGKSYGSFMFFANAFNLQKLSSKEFRLFMGGKLGGVKLYDVNLYNQFRYLYKVLGRETGIRTLGTLAGTTDFESVPFDHSGTSPHMKFAFR